MVSGAKAKIASLILSALLLFLPSVAWAVPLPLQGAILVQALKYEQNAKDKRARPLVVILHGSDNAKQAQELAEALGKLKAEAKVVSRGQLADALKGASALYIFPGQIDDDVLALCAKLRVLSFSAEVKDVEAGRAAMCVGVHEDKPQLVINLKRVTVEGRKFSSRLLKLARVIE